MFRVALSRLFRLDFWRCFQRQLSRQPFRAEQGCGHSKFLLRCFVRGYAMSSAFIQTGFTSSTAFVIALIVLVLAVGLMAFLFVRSSAQRREREGRMGVPMVGGGPGAPIAVGGYRGPNSMNPADVAPPFASVL